MMGEVREVTDSVSLPPGYEWSFGRWQRQAEQDEGGALFGILLALALIYLIMAALFESFVQLSQSCSPSPSPLSVWV